MGEGGHVEEEQGKEEKRSVELALSSPSSKLGTGTDLFLKDSVSADSDAHIEGAGKEGGKGEEAVWK